MYDIPPPEFHFILADISRRDTTAVSAIEQFKQIIHAGRNLSKGCSPFESFNYNFCRRVLSLYADEQFFFDRACGVYKQKSRFSFRHWLQKKRLYVQICYETAE